MTVNSEDFNKGVAGWTTKVRNKIKYRIGRLTNKGKGELIRSLRSKSKRDYGEIDQITFQFARHGVFVHKGVGKGYVMKGGRVVRGYKPKVLRKRKQSLPPVEIPGVMNRRPKEWFNPTLEKNIPELADMVAEMRSEQAVNATRMMIE